MEAIEKSALECICEPIETARGIPNQFYTSAPHFAAEREAANERPARCLAEK
jgi:hypothetical protein